MSTSVRNRNLKLQWLLALAAILIVLSVIPACQKDTPEEPAQNKYLVSYRYNNTYSVSAVKPVLTVMQSIYPEITSIVSNCLYDVKVYIVNYNTTCKGQSIVASGLICVPVAKGPFPVVSFQNGTNTQNSNCPSLNPTNTLYTLMEYMAADGYIVTIPDYIGFGASSGILHPYYDRQSTDQAVVDMIRTCHEMLGSGDIEATASGKHFLMGYSQGGWSTLSALKTIETSYKTEIPVAAASCGAGAYDMMAMADYLLPLKTFPGPLYLPYFIYSEQMMGALTTPLNTFFKEPYASRIPSLFNGTLSNQEVDAQLTDSIPDLLTANMIANFGTGAEFLPLRTLLVKNSVTAWVPATKINFYHGTADQNVPPAQSQLIYDGFTSLGVGADKVQLFRLPGTDHESSLIPWGLMTINWFNSMKN